MPSGLAYRTGLVLLMFLIGGLETRAQHAGEGRFYAGRTFGSEAVFNPLSVLLNEGYGIIQLDEWPRTLGGYPYQAGFRNVAKSLANPFRTISRYGVRRFITSELLPLSTRGTGGGQWAPNYQLHLLGGGMVHAALHEWYEHHGYPYPGLLSFATATTVHLLNETIENNTFTGYNGDAVADIYVFDLAGMLLFRSERVQRFFSETLILRSWLAQPAFTWSDVTLQNNGQFFALKWSLPFAPQWHAFYYFGMNNLWGLSYRRTGGASLSLGIGFHAKKLVVLDVETNRKTAELVPTVGLFYDWDHSLVASLVYNGLQENTVSLNVYPGVLKLGPVSPGLWAVVNREGQLILGLSTAWTPGLAFRF